MRLVDLLSDYRWDKMPGKKILNTRILGITADSRNVQPGFLFVALEGTYSDGREFISDAINAGAVAIVASHDTFPEILQNTSLEWLPACPQGLFSSKIKLF